MTATKQELETTVLDALTEIAPEIERAQIGPTTNLRQDLDLDSMDFLSFTLRLGELLHVELREADYPELSTLPGCVALLQRKLAARSTPAAR
ncbi:MAG: acyl carrier protein [Deltaproteobacteria bacterium]|nr:acyl carrier protein [Deltaproteobacteria bacterium]